MGTTTVFGLPYPEETDLVMDGSQAIEDLAEAVDTKLGGEDLEVTCTGSASGGGGWTISSFFIRRSGLMIHISGNATRTVSDLTVPADGNIIPNNDVAYLSPAGGDQAPLPAHGSHLGSGGNGRLCSFIIDTGAVIYLTSTAPGGGDIAVGDVISFNGVYLADEYVISD